MLFQQKVVKINSKDYFKHFPLNIKIPSREKVKKLENLIHLTQIYFINLKQKQNIKTIKTGLQ